MAKRFVAKIWGNIGAVYGVLRGGSPAEGVAAYAHSSGHSCVGGDFPQQNHETSATGKKKERDKKLSLSFNISRFDIEVCR